MSFIDELKRRKVVRVVLAYSAIAFAVAQGATTFFPVLHLPEWTVTLVVVACLLGLPVAAVLAWAFDVTDAGIVRTSDVAPVGARVSRGRPLIAAIVIVVFLALGGAFAWKRLRSHDPALDNDLIAVLPFSVRADPSLAYLREGMVDLLASTLATGTGIRAADPRTALSAWRRVVGDEKNDLPPDSALLVARAIGAGRVLLGSIVGNTDNVTVTADIFTLPNGARTARATMTGKPSDVSALVDGLTAQLLSLNAGEQEDRLATLTSTSLAALKEYLAGQSAFRRARFGEAAMHFDNAIQEDSTFALAALGLRLTAGWGEVQARNLPRANRLARNYRQRLTESDREYVEALVGPTAATRSIREGLDAWSAYTQRYPENANGWFQYADVLLHYAPMASVPDGVAQAKPLFDRSLQLDSSFTPALIHLIDYASLIDHDPREFTRLRSILERQGSAAETATYQYWTRTAFSGDSTELRRFRQALDTLPELILGTIPIFWFMGVGTADDAENAVSVLQRRAATPAERTQGALSTHELFMNMGRVSAARRQIEEIRARDPSPEWDAMLLQDAMFWDGDADAARAAAARLAPLFTSAANRTPTLEERSAACALGEWRLRQRDSAAYDVLVALLEKPDAAGTAHAPSILCAAILRTLHESLGGNTTKELERLDSLAAVGYGGVSMLRQANALLVQLHEQRGEKVEAAQAAARRSTNDTLGEFYSVWLRDAGRTALAVSDTARAIEYWTEYLRLRVRPDPSGAVHDEVVRRDLQQLTKDRKR